MVLLARIICTKAIWESGRWGSGQANSCRNGNREAVDDSLQFHRNRIISVDREFTAAGDICVKQNKTKHLSIHHSLLHYNFGLMKMIHARSLSEMANQVDTSIQPFT